MTDQKPKVVIIGAGFAGIHAAKELRHAPVQVVLLDGNNYHLFNLCCTRWPRLPWLLRKSLTSARHLSQTEEF
jgi:NADH dehydrogenase FAD-containing subunit